MTPLTYPNIEAERAKKRLSQKDFAKEMEVTVPTYRSWIEKGKIPSQKLERMANFFGCTTDYLLSRSTGAREN